MKRRIIEIDQEKCNGCGACAAACHEGAIGMVNGKAVLLRDDYCDGLGDCLPACPTSAISFIEREAAPYDKDAVEENMRKKQINYPEDNKSAPLPCGCPGSLSKSIRHSSDSNPPIIQNPSSCLSQWPVQIKLAPVNAAYFNNANLLVAADCTAYAYAAFHQDFIKNHITLIGCPKLDDIDYSEKLEQIISGNNIKSVTVVRMEVPCCGGIENAVKNALKRSGKFIPWRVVTVNIDGSIGE